MTNSHPKSRPITCEGGGAAHGIASDQQCTSRVRRFGERGEVTSTVLVFGAVLLLVMVMFQTGFYLHGRNVVRSAVAGGVNAAATDTRLDPATEVRTRIELSGSTFVNNVAVTATDNGQGSFTVTATASPTQLLPFSFGRLEVTETVSREPSYTR